MYVINGLQDQTLIYVIARFYTGLLNIFLPSLGSCLIYPEVLPTIDSSLLSNQPLQWVPYFISLSLVGWPFIFIYILIVTLLVFIFSYVLFKKYRFGLVFSLLFTFSSFYWIQLGIHQELMQVWLLVALLILFSKINFNFSSKWLLLVLLVCGALISNYLGFVMYLTLASLVVACVVNEFFNNNLTWKFPMAITFTILLSLLTLSILLFPYMRGIFLPEQTKIENRYFVERPYEDFVTFSLRPWYFFIPSPKNPVYGQFSQSVIQKIESTGYFLADDYFPAEHSAAFFGYLFLITFASTLIYGYKKLNPETKQKVNTLLLTTIILISFTMPPYFTVSGLKIYTPGHLIATFFPMFRVTARFSPMILLLMLLIMAEIINVIHVYKPKFFRIFMPILLVVTLVETFVPFKITKYDKVPDPYVYMGTQQPMTIKYLVYPYSKSNESFFWLPDHKQCLMNVRGYNYENISAEELTLKLFEPGMLEQAKTLGTTHILFYEPEEYLDQISALNSLELVQQFSDSALYIIN